MKKLSALILLVSILFAGCEQKEDIQTSEPLILGAVYDLTGNQSTLDIPSSRGAALAIDQINAAGGIDGREIQLILEDGETDIDVLKNKVNSILTEYPEVAAFMGLSDTDQVLAAAKPAADAGRVFVTSGATSPQLPQQIEDYLYLACFGDNVQAAAAAEYAFEELGARTVSIVYDSSTTYTSLLQAYFANRFEELGGQVLAKAAYANGQMSGAIQAIPSADFIFFSALPQDAPSGAQLIRQAGFSGPIFGGDAYDEPALWESLGDISEVYFTTHVYLDPDNQEPQIQAFLQAYQQMYGEAPNAFAALGYDAARLLIKAVENADSTDPEEIRTALGQIQNFSGLTGNISYDSNSRIPQKSVTIMMVNQGNQKFVTQLLPKKIPLP